MSADGTWNTTMNTPMGAQNGTLTLATDGAALTGLGRYAEAEPLLLASHPVIQQQTGGRSSPTRAVLEYLVTLYEAWPRPDRATEYRALLDAASSTP